MNEDDQLQALINMIRPYLGLLLGNNSSDLGYLDMIEGKTHQAIRAAKYENKRRKRLLDPFVYEAQDLIGENMYRNMLGLVGYTKEGIDAHLGEKGIGRSLADFAFRHLAGMQLGGSHSAFLGAALDRRHSYAEPQAYRYMQDYGKITEYLLDNISKGHYATLSSSDVLNLGAHLISTGRYDMLGISASDAEYVLKEDGSPDTTERWGERATKIHNDLTSMARSVSRLKDALGGSMEEVLKAYESLSGSSVGVTAAHRLDSISRMIDNAYTYGGVTTELLASQVTRQIQANRGVGTQQLAMVQGTIVAGAMARPITVENATAETVNDLLSKKQSEYLMTGQLKNLSAAYTWFLNGKTHTDATWSEFYNNAMHGDVSFDNIQKYLREKGVSASFINSTLVSNNMSLPMLSQALTTRDIASMEEAWGKAVQRESWLTDAQRKGLSGTDILYADFGELQARAEKLGIDRNNYGKLEEFVRRFRSFYMPGADSRDALAAMSQMSMQVKYSRINSIVDLVAGLDVNQSSIGGLQGLFQTLSREPSANALTVNDIVRSYLGMGDAGNLGALGDKNFASLTTGDIEILVGKVEKSDEAKNYIKALQGMSKAEREYFFGQIYYDSKKLTTFERNAAGEIITETVNGIKYSKLAGTDNPYYVYNNEVYELSEGAMNLVEVDLNSAAYSTSFGQARLAALKAYQNIAGGKAASEADIKAIKTYTQILRSHSIIGKKDVDRTNFMMLNPTLARELSEKDLEFSATFAATVGNADSRIDGGAEGTLYANLKALRLDKAQDGKIDDKRLYESVLSDELLSEKSSKAWVALSEAEKKVYGSDENEAKKKFHKDFVDNLINTGSKLSLETLVQNIYDLLRDWLPGSKVTTSNG